MLNNLGYCVIPNVFSPNEISDMRPVLESKFDELVGKASTSLPWHDIGDSDPHSNLISSLFFDGRISRMLNQLFPNENVRVLPALQMHKNYLPHSRRKSWHVDSGSLKLKSKYRSDLSNKSFKFGHIGIYFQENGPYGGSIDVFPGSHWGLKSGNAIVMKGFDYVVQILARFPTLSSPLRRLVTRRIEVNLGDVILFDWRVFHRGSPASRKIEKTIEFSSNSYRAELPPHFSKLSLYSRFGNSFGWDIHMQQMKDAKSSEVADGSNFLENLQTFNLEGYDEFRLNH